MKQVTNSVLMVCPVAFRMNEQTTANNYFQKELNGILPAAINAKAQQEFDALVSQLESVEINVIVVEDILEKDTPDSIFPNNWISFHENGDVVLYPMFAENRRDERRDDILDILEEKGFVIDNVIDFTSAEEDGIFLEGTGSLVLDRANSIAYCALSPRADEELFIEFCEDFDYAPVIFEAFHTVEGKKELIYHTNVMMSIGEHFAIICSDMIADKKERKMVLDNLRESGKELILISEKQVGHFAGNVLELSGANDKRFIVMSATAFESLNATQKSQLEKHGSILNTNLQTIETCGGGSARCMIAEVFLPKN
jgi:hypothetical protein